MNLVVSENRTFLSIFSTYLVVFLFFTLFGIHTCAVLQPTPSPSLKVDLFSDVGQGNGRSLPLVTEKKDSEKLDDHPGDHDRDDKTASSGSSVKARKGVTYGPLEESQEKEIDGNKTASTILHSNSNLSNDRASTTIIKSSENVTNKTSESTATTKSKGTSDSDRSSYRSSEKYSPYDTKSTDTSSTNASSSSNYSRSSSSTESTTSSKSSFNKKPLVTYSVEDDSTLLNIPKARQVITPLTTLDETLVHSNFLPPSSDFVLDRMESKREMYIFPLVVLIFLVPMVLGVGIIILRRVRDYWSTRHYRRMDFLVDGMYNT